MSHRHTQFIRASGLVLCSGLAAAASTMAAPVESPAATAKQAVTAPFQLHLTGTVSNGFFCGATYTVPAGTHVHIDYVGFRSNSTLSGQITLGGEVDVNVNPTTSPFQTYLNPLQGNLSTVFGYTLFTGGQQIVAEADPGSVIAVGYYFGQSDSSLACEVGISGHMQTVT